MSRWVLARPGTHTRRTLRAPDGSCMACGDDVVESVAMACAECRGLDWASCESCGAGWPDESIVINDFNPEEKVCPECLAEHCPTCGMKGYCKCCHADDLYDRYREEGW